MTTAKIINAAFDWIADRTAMQWKLAGLIALVGVLAVGIARHDATTRDEGAQAVRDALAASTAVRLHRQKDAIGRRIDTQTVRVTRSLARVDTLWKSLPETPTTPADTSAWMNALPVLRRTTDSAIAACSDFQLSCTEYRRVADSLETALRQTNDDLRRRLTAVQPSRFGRVLHWVEIGGAAYLGYRVGRR